MEKSERKRIWDGRKATMIGLGARLAEIASWLMKPNIEGDCEPTCIACWENVDDQRGKLSHIERELRSELATWNPKDDECSLMRKNAAAKRAAATHTTSDCFTDCLSFEDALRLLKMKKLMRRAGWNGKGMWVGLIPSGNRFQLEGLGEGVALEAFFVMRAPKIQFFTWTPSIADILADDWEVEP